jgi:hypothetical protein
MKTTPRLIALGFLMFNTAASAPRDAGLDIPSAQSISVLAKCIHHRLGQSNNVDLPNGGVSIQVGESRYMFIHQAAKLYFDITDGGDVRHINIHYRHPMTKGTAAKNLRIVGRKCFPYELDAAGGGVLPEAGTDGTTTGADKPVAVGAGAI